MHSGDATLELPTRLRFEFTANGWEYFRIWIANLCLSILTLGVYSAWAKVRRVRYFWGSTRLGDASFDYLADPIAILKGRMLVAAFFAGYWTVSTIWPLTQPAFGLLLLLLLPWAVVRSLVFRARNTAYRNLRFDFLGGYGETFAVYVLMPMLMVITLGLIYPYLVYRQKRLLVGHSAFGTARFRLGSTPGQFYGLFARASLLLLGSVALVAALLAVAMPAGLIAAPLLLLFLFAYVSAGISNLTYDETAVEGHSLEIDLRGRELAALYAGNALCILFTLGLFIPWARVRSARYRLSRLSLRSRGDLDSFVAAQLEDVGGAGAELGGLLDIDISL